MKRHFLFDRTERLFSQGQRALAERDFERALRILRAAIETDPAYPHLYMYLGRAQAELGALDEAVATIRRALVLAPANFVFPLEHGIWLLDAGRAQEARVEFRKAHLLSLTNTSIAGYEQLAAYDLGELSADVLRTDFRNQPLHLRARILVRLCERGLKSPAQLLHADSLESEAAHSRAFFFAGLRRRLILAKARRHLRDGNPAAAIAVCDRGHDDSELAQLLGISRHAAIQALSAYLASTNAEDPIERRKILRRLAELYLDVEDDERAYTALSEWKRLEDNDTDSDAAVTRWVLVTMARIDVRRGRPGRALAICREIDAAGRDTAVHWVKAIAALGAGDRRTARYELEDFLAASSTSGEALLARVLRLSLIVVGVLALFFR
jgi:tetratricopeptide (TPR) repeat protein